MKTNRIALVARLILGLGFFVFGLNGFLHFLPNPAEPEAAGKFLGALAETGYMFPLIKGTEVLAGVLLLTGLLVPLALTILAPVLVNIVAFHGFLAPAGLLVPLVLAALEIYLAWTERAAFAPLFRTRRTREAAEAPTGEVRLAA